MAHHARRSSFPLFTWAPLAMAALAFGALAFAGCAADGEGDFLDPVTPGSSISIEILGDPELEYDPQKGTTNVVVQFIARDGQDNPLSATELDVDMRLDGNTIDTEAILREDSEELSANIHLSLVLDASYSMEQHAVPAFEPMLSAARRTVQQGRNLYTSRPGVFNWNLYWFNDLIFQPTGTWPDFVIENIPSPDPGSFTKLYAAVDLAVEESLEAALSAPTDERHQHIMVVFSDGADNYSWFANPEVLGTSNITNDYAYDYNGYQAVTQAQLLNRVRDHETLQLHVIGLGSAVNNTALKELARVGRGRYFKNLSASEIPTLFDQVIREFTTIQTTGVTLPVPPGDYTFKIKVKDADGTASASHEFRFHGGDGNVRVIP